MNLTATHPKYNCLTVAGHQRDTSHGRHCYCRHCKALQAGVCVLGPSNAYHAQETLRLPQTVPLCKKCEKAIEPGERLCDRCREEEEERRAQQEQAYSHKCAAANCQEMTMSTYCRMHAASLASQARRHKRSKGAHA